MTEKKPVTKPAARRLAVLLNIESSLDRTEFTECVVMTANRRHRARRLRRRFLVDRDSGHARGASASLAGQHRIAPHIDEVGVTGRCVAGEACGLVVLSKGRKSGGAGRGGFVRGEPGG